MSIPEINVDHRIAAERGFELLGERLPGWRNLIDEYSLALSSGSNCVLGQVFGDYDRGVTALDVDAYEHGFMLSNSSFADYDSLQRSWLDLLNIDYNDNTVGEDWADDDEDDESDEDEDDDEF